MKLLRQPIFWLITAGSLTWSMVMVKSGIVYSFGMGFWGPNGHDGIWHIALINSLAKGSFAMPVFADQTIKNYHIGFDLLLAGIKKITFLPTVFIYFQAVPVIMSVLIGFFSYKFIVSWKNSKRQAFWAVFFIYFSGSFGWVVTLWRNHNISGESLFWAQQSLSTLINPPFALSLLLLFMSFFLLDKYSKKPTGKLSLLLIAVFAFIPQIKIYGGILSFTGLGIISLVQLIKEQKIEYFKIFIPAAIISAVLFFPLNRGASGLIVFQPLWFLETLMAISDRFYWPKFYEAMINYKAGHVWIKAIMAYGFSFGIFLLGNLGLRFLGFFEIWKNFKKRKIDYLEIFLLSLTVLGIIFPMFFLQRGTPWNTIQFFYYSLFIFGLFSGIYLSEKNRVWKLAVLVLTIPVLWATLQNYLPSRPPAKLGKEELEALNFLKKEPDGIVLTYPFDKEKADQAVSNPPRPLYLYETTAYVSAFSEKPTFLEDEVNLNITGYDWRVRRKAVEGFLNSLDRLEVRSFLKDNNISYIYWIGKQRARLGESQLGIKQIFENKEVKIYKVE